MTIGNPSAHCFANAPWRAFTWTCALLQETSTQPWGSLQEAVQESLDTAEHVDLHQLPGMASLWSRPRRGKKREGRPQSPSDVGRGRVDGAGV